jgi:hypothetical protein
MSLEDMYQGYDLPPSSRSIRVLDIYPVPGSSENIQAEPVMCTFRVIDLNDSPHFTALSYVWGKDSPTSQYSIVCEGVQVPVTQNCQSALKHLRQRLGQFSIWVDALCIKQNDLVEKAQQIPLMSDIYSNAAFVYVWLGEGTPATDRAMHYLANNPIEKYFRTSRPIAAAWTLSSAPYNLLKSPIPLTRQSMSFSNCGYYYKVTTNLDRWNDAIPQTNGLRSDRRPGTVVQATLDHPCVVRGCPHI